MDALEKYSSAFNFQTPGNGQF